MWLRLIVEVVLLALTVVSIVSTLRALGPIRKLVERGTKPWSCDVCLGFWTTLIASIVGCIIASTVDRQGARPFLELAIVILPAHGLALMILSRLRPPVFPFGTEKEMSHGD
jgi:hypothetical protein